MKRLFYVLMALGLPLGGVGQATAQPSYTFTTLDSGVPTVGVWQIFLAHFE
jgi:hypothetical protein